MQQGAGHQSHSALQPSHPRRCSSQSSCSLKPGVLSAGCLPDSAQGRRRADWARGLKVHPAGRAQAMLSLAHRVPAPCIATPQQGAPRLLLLPPVASALRDDQAVIHAKAQQQQQCTANVQAPTASAPVPSSSSAARKLTGSIKGAYTVEELHDLLHHHSSTVNHLHLVAALTRLARLAGDAPLLPASLPAALYDHLMSSLQPVLHLMRPRELSNILWAAANLSSLPQESWLHSITRQMHHHLQDFNGKDVGMTAWALGRLHYNPGQAWLSDFFSTALSPGRGLDAQAVSNLAWGMAKLCPQVSTPVMDRLAGLVEDNLVALSPQGHANALWAFTTWGRAPSPAWSDQLSRLLTQRVDSFAPKELSMILFSLGRVNKGTPGVSEAAIHTAAQSAFQRITTLTGQEAVWMLWGVLQLHYHPGQQALQAWFNHTQHQLHTLDNKSLANAVLAAQKLQHHSLQQSSVPVRWYGAVLQASAPRLQRMDTQALAVLARGLALSNTTPYQAWLACFMTAVQQHLTAVQQTPASVQFPDTLVSKQHMNHVQLMCLVCSLARWRAAPSPGLQQALNLALSHLVPDAPAKPLINTLMAMTQLDITLPNSVAQQVSQRLNELEQSCTASELQRIMHLREWVSLQQAERPQPRRKAGVPRARRPARQRPPPPPVTEVDVWMEEEDLQAAAPTQALSESSALRWVPAWA